MNLVWTEGVTLSISTGNLIAVCAHRVWLIRRLRHSHVIAWASADLRAVASVSANPPHCL